MADSARYLLSPTDALAAVAEGALLVDVREDASREAQGRIAGAHVVDKTVLTIHVDGDQVTLASQINSLDTRIVIFCTSEAGSIGVVDGLRSLGFTEVYHVSGGFPALREVIAPELILLGTTATR